MKNNNYVKIKSVKWAVSQIKNLNIQGAHNVAVFSLQTIKHVIKTVKSDAKLYRALTEARSLLISSRPTEPAMRNALFYVFHSINKSSPDRNVIISKIDEAIEFLNVSNNIVATIGSRKIKDSMHVYTHCHASSVIGILKKALLSEKISFTVNNTETRPLYQGRKTAKELSDLGISVEHYVDSAMRIAIRNSDIVLIGADAITQSKIYNKIGSELICETAYRYDIPVYVCTVSWKFDPMSIAGYDEVIEERPSFEVWDKPPKNVKIKNYAFEKINPKLITGIISELGIYSHSTFIEEVKKKYPWMIDNPEIFF